MDLYKYFPVLLHNLLLYNENFPVLVLLEAM